MELHIGLALATTRRVNWAISYSSDVSGASVELKQLKYFSRVAQMGSVSKAAASLSVAQPAISRQIAQLEDELGVPLFFRNGRGVTLTEAGHVFFGRATAILDQTLHAEQEMRDLRSVISGTVSLGLPPTAAQVLVVPLIQRLRTLYPELTLQVREAFSGYVNEWLSFGALDIAVLYDAPRGRQLVTEDLVHEDLFLVGPPDGPQGPIPFAELAKLPLILPSQPHGLRLLVDKIAAEADLTLRTAFEIDALSVIKDLVESGIGFTILPSAAVHRERAAGTLGVRKIVEPTPSRTLVLSTSSQRPLTNATRAVVKELKGVVRELIRDRVWHGAY